jgi:hypothetical protein
VWLKAHLATAGQLDGVLAGLEGGATGSPPPPGHCCPPGLHNQHRRTCLSQFQGQRRGVVDYNPSGRALE